MRNDLDDHGGVRTKVLSLTKGGFEMMTTGFIVCGIVSLLLFALCYFLWSSLKMLLAEHKEQEKVIESQRKEIKHLSSVCSDRLNEAIKFKEMVGKERDEYTAICRKNSELNEEIKKGSELVKSLAEKNDKDEQEIHDLEEKVGGLKRELDAAKYVIEQKDEDLTRWGNKFSQLVEQSNSQNEAILMLKRELKEKDGERLEYLNTLIQIDDLIHENVDSKQLERL